VRSTSGLPLLIGCCLTTIAALLVVGVISHGVVRHLVQTSPLWLAVVLGASRSTLTRWAALPCLLFWLVLMVTVWLYLLGWVWFISGTFSPAEIALTVVVAAAAAVGLVQAVAMRSTGGRPSRALATIAVVGLLQVLAFRLSLTPQIAHR
jgi:hypothetical protein